MLPLWCCYWQFFLNTFTCLNMFLYNFNRRELLLRWRKIIILTCYNSAVNFHSSVKNNDSGIPSSALESVSSSALANCLRCNWGSTWLLALPLKEGMCLSNNVGYILFLNDYFTHSYFRGNFRGIETKWKWF